MEINEITRERIADAVLSAMKREGLLSKEAAVIFGFPASYMSSLIRHREDVPHSAWAKMRAWMITGGPLKEYKRPEPTLEPMPGVETAPADNVSTTADPLPQEKKRGISKELREKFEQAKQNEKSAGEPTAPEDVIIRGKNGKIDLSDLDIRTGTLARFVSQIMEDGSFSLEYHPRR
jgi:hypothetical protein